ncbi:MAG: RNA polymerase sigma factor RpoE [Brachymonas sp.]
MLVQRTLEGEQRAFELLVLKYQHRIERLVRRMVRDVDLVPDITQETFIRAYRALHQFRGDAQFYTWLYRIAMNTARKALLDLKRNPTVSDASLSVAGDEDDETFLQHNEPTSEETPEAVMAAREVAEAVHQALEDLPEELGRALTLREMDGMSYEDIAQEMGCPVGTVRSRIFRAREAVARKLRPLLDHRTGKRW